MKITNEQGLPQPLIDAVNDNTWEQPENVIRVTQLLKGVRETVLERRHDDELSQDVSDMVWLIFGTAVHSIAEQGKETRYQVKETRMSERVHDSIVSGQFDLYDAKQERVIDYKTCSAWKLIYRDFDDWRRQTLIYCWLLRRAGFKANSGEIVAFIKDHSKSKARQDRDYPRRPVERIVFQFYEKDFGDIEAFIFDRVKQIEIAQELPDDELPLCTKDERWTRDEKWAVMGTSSKKALRLLDSEYEAKAWIKQNQHRKPKRIEYRPGIDVKCEDYCSAAPFCTYWKENYKK